MVNYSVDLGNILTVISFIVGGIAFASTIRSDVSGIKERLIALEKEMKDISDILIKLARQEERLNAMTRRIDDLSSYKEDKVENAFRTPRPT